MMNQVAISVYYKVAFLVLLIELLLIIQLGYGFIACRALLGNHRYTIAMLVYARGYSQSADYSCNRYSSLWV